MTVTSPLLPSVVLAFHAWCSADLCRNARRNHPLFVNVMIHELGHNWERSLRRVKLEVYTEVRGWLSSA